MSDRKRADESGQARLDTFALLAESIPQIVFTARADGTVDSFNERATLYTGVASSALAAASNEPVWKRIVHPGDLVDLLRDWRQALETRSAIETEVRLRRADGTYRWHAYSVKPLLSEAPGGSVTRWVGVCTDVHDKRTTPVDFFEPERLLEAVSLASTDAMFVKDREHRYRFVNRVAADVMGVPMSKVLGQPGAAFMLPADAARIHAIDEAIMASDAASHDDGELTFKGGRIHYSATKTPLHDAFGTVIGLVGVSRDVTAKQVTEDALRAESDRLAALAATVPGILYSFRLAPDGKATLPYASPRITELYDATPEELALDAGPALARCYAEDLDLVMAVIARSAETLEPLRVQYRLAHPTRGLRWIEAHSIPVREADGGTLWQGVLTDITERKVAEQKEHAATATLRSILDTVPELILSVNAEGQILFINRALPLLTVEEMTGSNVFDYLPPESIDEARAAVGKVFANGQIEEYEVQGPVNLHGKRRAYLTRIGPVMQGGVVVAVTVTGTDITDRKLAVQAVKASEEQYRRLIDVLPDAVYVHLRGTITLCNAAFARLVGASSPSELIGRTTFDFHPPEKHAKIREIVAEMNRTGRPPPPSETEILRLDGRAVRVMLVATPMHSDGDPSILVAIHDLTELRKSEGLLRTVLQSVPDAIITTNAQGAIESSNPAAERLFGHSNSDLQRINVRTLIADADKLRVDASHSPSPQSQSFGRPGAPPPSESGLGETTLGTITDVTATRADGSTLPAELLVTDFWLEGARHFTWVVRDITDRKKLEDQFRQSQKMEAVGQLAGGIAHDFNNLLTVILGDSELLLSVLPEDDPTVPSIEAIRDAGEHAQALTRQLLAFGRKTVLEPKVLDLNQIVSDTEKMLRRLLGEDVVLTTALEPSLEKASVDANQVSQALMNLSVNARDAMPNGGALRISTTNIDVGETTPGSGPGIQPGRYVRLTVTDTGSGMTPEVKARAFQPFFTTKGTGKGSGLGLAVVHGIVSQSGGYIDLITEPGVGTTFDIYIPAAKPRVEVVVKAEPAPARRGRETLIVVEDEEAVRRLAVRVLKSRGYEVLSASDGVEALKVIEAHEGRIDVLLTDVVMPNMDGRELAEVVSRLFPKIKVLYMSGYTDDVVLRRGVMADEVEFLQKPYTPALLSAALERVLDKPQ